MRFKVEQQCGRKVGRKVKEFKTRNGKTLGSFTFYRKNEGVKKSKNFVYIECVRSLIKAATVQNTGFEEIFQKHFFRKAWILK